MTVYDLGDISRIVDHADASPAPTSGPGDPPIPTGPWAPTVTRQQIVADARANHPELAKLADLVEDNPRLFRSAADTLADVKATLARHGRGSAELERAA